MYLVTDSSGPGFGNTLCILRGRQSWGPCPPLPLGGPPAPLPTATPGWRGREEREGLSSGGLHSQGWGKRVGAAHEKISVPGPDHSLGREAKQPDYGLLV
jgi:hypothetical protein